MIHHIIRLISVLILSGSLTVCSDGAKLRPLDAGATIIAFGDSLTYGTGTSRNKAYPAILETLTGYNVINAGVPGEITRDGLARLPGLIKKYHPALIIICHGGNDILRKLDHSNTRDNIQQMIDLARKENSDVVLVGVPEFGLFLSPLPIYQSLADENHVPIANNILPDILGNNALKSDHIHPNTRGYQLLADSIITLLQTSGAIKQPKHKI
ncbi:MAG: arylesterase [Gammaproteobacteria bacterium]|nr:arylesterase [Gammaproteobacteria bacterium]